MNQNIIQSCIVSLLICFLLYKLLCNRTIEVEKFSNQQIVYRSNGKELIKKGPIIE